MNPEDGEVHTIAGNARQTLKQLKERWGVQAQDWTVAPVLVVVDVMGDHRETWKKYAPAGEPKKLLDTEYELIERRTVTLGTPQPPNPRVI